LCETFAAFLHISAVLQKLLTHCVNNTLAHCVNNTLC